ncbi:CGNR zinc finger domain-containing protein [Virgibacillus salexigens]|uniref:CGNR zinc finger domain-containing protein n=1 Tax=Virgibacillus salexigens TaxID=61016 RepID=UPI00190A5532|nr:CGNR zinc finger domain-containing protein [Virgibacillus salexigens]
MKYYNESWLSFTLAVINTYDPYYKEPERLNSTVQLRDLTEKHGLFFDELPTLKDVRAIRTYRDNLRNLIIRGSDTNLVDFLTECESHSPIKSKLYIKENGNFDFFYEESNRKDSTLKNSILAICSFTLGRELVEYGRDRLKVCVSAPCEEIFVDHSKNGLQRFCSKRCSNRFHVNKHRESNKLRDK